MAGAVVHGVGSGSIRDEQRDMVKRAVVHIDTNDSKLGKGSGFIAELPVSRVLKKAVLMTCNHLLPSLEVAQKSTIYFGRSSKDSPGTMIEGHELFDSQYFLTDNESFSGWGRRFDYTVVEVKMAVLQKYLMDEVPEPLSLAKCEEMMKNEDLCLGNTVYIVHYPAKGGTFSRHENAEQICSIEGPYIGHMATTSGGSGGSPLLREYNNELIVIGLHRGDLSSKGDTYTKLAALITVIVADVQMKYYDDSNFPQVESFALEAKKHAMELKNQAAKQPPPDEETEEKEESSDGTATPTFRVKGEGGPSDDDVLDVKVYDSRTKDGDNHLVILRQYVSRKALDKKTALLEALDFTSAEIAQYSRANPGNEEEAIQAGLVAWISRVHPTWGQLLKKMETAGIGKPVCSKLREMLCQQQVSCDN